jgi:hypothetical protein
MTDADDAGERRIFRRFSDGDRPAIVARLRIVSVAHEEIMRQSHIRGRRLPRKA